MEKTGNVEQERGGREDVDIRDKVCGELNSRLLL